MTKSAGILPYRTEPDGIEVFLVHQGGPFWRGKKRSWSIPKGIVEEGESDIEAAKREFKEETGYDPSAEWIDLGYQKSGTKTVHIFAMNLPNLKEEINSNSFEIEWPPGSKRIASFVEADKGGWFPLREAKEVIVSYQIPFLERLAREISGDDLKGEGS